MQRVPVVLKSLLGAALISVLAAFVTAGMWDALHRGWTDGRLQIGVRRRPGGWEWVRNVTFDDAPVLFLLHFSSYAAMAIAMVLLAVSFWLLLVDAVRGDSELSFRQRSGVVRALLRAAALFGLYWAAVFFGLRLLTPMVV